MALKKSDIIAQMNLPSFLTDAHQQYRVLKQIRKLGNYDVVPLDAEFASLLKEVVIRLPHLNNVSTLVKLFKAGPEELGEYLQNVTSPPIKFIVPPEDKIYLKTKDGSFLREFVEYSRMGNAPLAFYFWAGVALLGAACRRKFAYSGTITTYMNMYIILGAARAGGKGQALKGLLDVMHKANKKVEKIHQETLRTDPVRAYSYRDMEITHIPTDSTQEAIVSQLHHRQRPVPKKLNNGRLENVHLDATGIIAADELATLLGKDTYNSNRKSAFLVEMKDSKEYGKNTKKDGDEGLNNCALTLIACCAPDWLGNSISREMLTGGFTDRITWIYRLPNWDMQEQISITHGKPKDPTKADALADWLVECVLAVEDLELVEPTLDAKDRLNEIWLGLVRESKKNFEDMGLDDSNSSASRLYQSIVQLSSLLCISEIKPGRTVFEPIIMTEDHVEMAYTIVTKENKSMITFLSEAKRDESSGQTKAVIAKLRDLGGCAKRSILQKDLSRTIQFSSAKQVRDCVVNMAENGDLVVDTMYKGGRPTEVYKLPTHGECEKCLN